MAAKAAGADGGAPAIHTEKFDALLFDLDGVITQSMTIHAQAWKLLFDDYLKERAEKSGEPFVPFDKDAEYRAHVDGKPRYDGVAAFLESRGISLPRGESSDDPSRETICGLGNKKNGYFQSLLRKEKVAVYASSVVLIRQARARGLKTAVVSSSRNCKQIVDSVGIADLFDTRVDGLEVENMPLKGKPAPDMFLEAARRLQVEPARGGVL